MDKLRLAVEHKIKDWKLMHDCGHVMLAPQQSPPSTIVVEYQPQGAQLVHTMSSDDEAFAALAVIVDAWRRRHN